MTQRNISRNSILGLVFARRGDYIGAMIPGRTIRFCLSAVIAIAMMACVVTMAEAASAFPYQKIIDRNAFALREPPPPAPDPTQIKPPPPKITATGIASIFGRTVGLMKVLEPTPPAEPGKPPGPAQEQSYILAVGERQGEIEVLAIDEKAATIKVSNYGTEQLLPLKTNLPPPTAPTPAPGAPPGVAIQPPVAGVPGAAAPPGGAPFAPIGGSVTTIGGTASATTAARTTIPTRTLRLPTLPGAPPQPQASGLSPEEQFILLHAIRENNADMPPAPPLPDSQSAPPMVPPMPQ